MSHVEFITLIVKLNLQVYVIIVIHIYLWVQLQESQTQQQLKQQQIIEKIIIIKYCPLFTNCTNNINNTQIGNAKEIDTVMPMHNLIRI